VRADLRPESCLLPPSARQRVASPWHTGFEVRPRLPVGVASAGELSAGGRGAPSVPALGPSAWRVEAAAGTPLLLQHGAEGCTDVWLSTYAPLRGAALGTVELLPTALCSLAIESEHCFEVEGPLADELAALHPGPLTLVLGLADGRSVALALGRSSTLRTRRRSWSRVRGLSSSSVSAPARGCGRSQRRDAQAAQCSSRRLRGVRGGGHLGSASGPGPQSPRAQYSKPGKRATGR